ncbi:UNVERIFIED_CONTAM: hypothetical protein H355_005828 [Colinus virginianus]|nr:hypothetical protein H355_005828 [Colinus virginianus]
MERAVLCVLCGLPAAGKSTLGRAVRRRLPLRHGWDCALLVYDDLIPLEEEWRRGEPPEGDCAWKRRRRELLRHLERLLRALRSGPAAPEPGPPSWGRFVSRCAEQGLLPGRSGGNGARPLCLVLDDNFYYRSMRYEVFQLARKYSLGFCQLFLECPLELCLHRNRLRDRPVPEETVRRMAQRMEAPEPEKNPWERHSLILSCSACAPEEHCDVGLPEASLNVLPSEMRGLAEELNKLKAEVLEDVRQGSRLEGESGQHDPSFDPAASVLCSFQREATNVVNKYILK